MPRFFSDVQLPRDNVREHQCAFCKNLSLLQGTLGVKEAYIRGGVFW